MARDKLNAAAYDLSVFEETQKKINKKNKKKKSNLIKINAKKNIESLRRKTNPALIAAVSLCTAAVTAVGVWIVGNNVKLNELNQEVTDARTELSHQVNLQDEFQMRIDGKLTSSMIEDYAESKLGMSQVKNAQKKFVSLSDGDFGEVIRNDGSNTFLEWMKNMFDNP